MKVVKFSSPHMKVVKFSSPHVEEVEFSNLCVFNKLSFHMKEVGFSRSKRELLFTIGRNLNWRKM